jgi:hypothetical protein
LRNSHDDEQERRVRLLLLSKGAVLAHWFDRPLAAELDESEQRLRAAPRVDRCSDSRKDGMN